MILINLKTRRETIIKDLDVDNYNYNYITREA